MVLSSELVRSRRKGEVLVVVDLKNQELEEAQFLAEQLLSETRDAIGLSLEELEETLAQVERLPKAEKIWAGLKKVILDDCEFTSPVAVEPILLRKTLFELATSRRATLSDGQDFPRAELLEQVAAQFGESKESMEDALYSDLKGAQRLRTAPQLSAKDLVQRYEKEHLQGVLLRAVSLTAYVHCSDPLEYRNLFRKLKFRQLLYRLHKLDDGGYQIDIEGPFSLFEAVTKYGLQFSLVLPALLECGSGRLVAELRWGKERRPLRFERAWSRAQVPVLSSQANPEELDVRPEIAALIEGIRKKKTLWNVALSTELLHIPGEGLCIADVEFTRADRPTVYLELLGFWSRDAVWRRVEWSQAGQHERVIFAVSSRLRVSEDVLPAESMGSLYVFKGAMSAASVLKQVESLSERKK